MLIRKAINFAFEKHKGQKRKGSGLEYVVHPMRVMELVQKYKSTSKHLEELKCAIILHDVMEDCGVTYFEIQREFGSLVASLVQGLTSDETQIKKLGKHEYLMQKLLMMTQYEFTLKLLDRMDNILDQPTKKYVLNTIEMLEYLEETRKEITITQKVILKDLNKFCLDKLAEIQLKEGV